MSSAPAKPVVLLAEDSEDDAFFFRWNLQKAGLACDLIHASDGGQALQILQQRCGPAAASAPARCPDLVFLDLKMPALTGFELLEWIQAHPFDPPLDVAVLSGSDHASDVARAKALGASAYYVKPISTDHLRARFAAWRDKNVPPARSA